ncbi:MAG: septum formation initiator family protein [Sphaerochaeta sp.]|jgi:cell division protein FtsB
MRNRSLLAGVITYFLTFLLFLAIFGEGGYLHNQALSQQIEQLSYNQNLLNLQIQALQRQESLMDKEDALRDAAFKYGYQSEGEVVYYFPLEERQGYESPKDIALEAGGEYFEGVGKKTLALWSIGPAFFVFFITYVITKRRRFG